MHKDRRGRKAETEGESKTKLIYAKISEKDYKRLIELADFLDLPKMTVTRNLILSSLDDAEMLKKSGALSIAKGIKRTNDFLKKLHKLKIDELEKKDKN